jgi:hypothetical protein
LHKRYTHQGRPDLLFILMTETRSKDGFSERINRWTLGFVNPREEQEYQEYIDTNTMMPWGMKVGTWCAVGLMLVNQSYNFIMIYGGFYAERSTRVVEICMATFLAAALGVEIVLRTTKRGKCFQGALIYLCMLTYAVTHPFVTNKWPVFGIQYPASLFP